MIGMEFEWDDEKYAENVKKHGIPFEVAALVFDDEFRIERFDEAHSDDEDRYNIIGMVEKVLFVVCTFRTENRVRIISARLADKDERREYEWQWL